MADGGPLAGWYPDPAGGSRLRWWDGSAWTAHVTPPAPAPVMTTLEDEATPARWARAALLAVPVAQVASAILIRGSLRHFLDQVRENPNGTASPPTFGTTAGLLAQVLGVVTVITGVLFLVWFARSARNARALGLPARREPAAAVAGFIVPIINFWWPYQSTCDLLPDERRNHILVLRWFLLWIVGGFVASALNIASAFVRSWVAWTLLAVSAVLLTLAALAAREVVSTVVDVHERLAARRGV
jgi:Domain of unknown function (DUF4328)/Protein of unknown function (DUF2510)